MAKVVNYERKLFIRLPTGLQFNKTGTDQKENMLLLVCSEAVESKTCKTREQAYSDTSPQQWVFSSLAQILRCCYFWLWRLFWYQQWIKLKFDAPALHFLPWVRSHVSTLNCVTKFSVAQYVWKKIFLIEYYETHHPILIYEQYERSTAIFCSF